MGERVAKGLIHNIGTLISINRTIPLDIVQFISETHFIFSTQRISTHHAGGKSEQVSEPRQWFGFGYKKGMGMRDDRQGKGEIEYC